MKHPPYIDSKGNKIPSVTEITKLVTGADALMGWAYKLGVIGKNMYKERAKAMKTGTETHEFINAFDQNPDKMMEEGIPKDKEEVRIAFSSFLSFHNNHKYSTVANELRMICECPFHEPYGGTMDKVAIFDKDSLQLLDWKTGEKVYENYLMQLIGYAHLWENGFVVDGDEPNQLGKRIDGFHIVCLSKDNTSYKDYFFKREDDQEQCWLDCVKLHYSKNMIKELL